MEFIKVINPDIILINADLLGPKEAWLWIGNQENGPSDNDDERVKAEREQAKLYPKVGSDGKIRPSGIEAIRIKRDKEFDNWYYIDTSEWSHGIYRFNVHSDANQATVVGTPLDVTMRDREYSWLGIGDPHMHTPDQKAFIYRENNGQGFCLRVEILPDRSIKPAGTWNK